MTTLHTFASGSSGNAALIDCGGVRFLLDLGISCRRIVTGLARLGLTPADLSAVCITHTHSDHIAGVRTFAKRFGLPICASPAACDDLAWRVPETAALLRPLPVGEETEIDGVGVTPFATSHDAPGACGYRFGGVGVLTDTGFVTDMAAEVLSGVELLLLEANHDVETLRSGPYPYYLKERILGPLGHLSNDDAAAFAQACARRGARQIVLAHLSRENNTPVMAYDAVARALAALEGDTALDVAPREELSPCYQAEEIVRCKR